MSAARGAASSCMPHTLKVHEAMAHLHEMTDVTFSLPRCNLQSGTQSAAVATAWSVLFLFSQTFLGITCSGRARAALTTVLIW